MKTEWERGQRAKGNVAVYEQAPTSTALPSVDEGLLALSRNRAVPGGAKVEGRRRKRTDSVQTTVRGK